MNDFKTLWTVYDKAELGKSALTGLVFYLLIGGVLVTPLITISFLFVPYMMFFLLAIYAALAFTGSYGTRIAFQTLATYQPIDAIDTERLIRRIAVGHAILVFTIETIVYFVYLR